MRSGSSTARDRLRAESPPPARRRRRRRGGTGDERVVGVALDFEGFTHRYANMPRCCPEYGPLSPLTPANSPLGWADGLLRRYPSIPRRSARLHGKGGSGRGDPCARIATHARRDAALRAGDGMSHRLDQRVPSAGRSLAATSDPRADRVDLVRPPGRADSQRASSPAAIVSRRERSLR